MDIEDPEKRPEIDSGSECSGSVKTEEGSGLNESSDIAQNLQTGGDHNAGESVKVDASYCSVNGSINRVCL